MRKLRLPIAEPCHENWDAMDAVDRGRFCQSCSKQVYHLSAMTEREARDLLREQAGARICVRYGCDGEGNIQFRPEPRRLPLTAAAAGALTMALAACTPHGAGETSGSERGTVLPIPMPTPVIQMMGEPPPIEEPEVMVMGAPPPLPPEPIEELMGDVAAPEPAAVVQTKMGEAQAVPIDEPEPCPGR